jgi:hypothetical protein
VMWNLRLIALILTPILLVGFAWFGFSRGTQYGMSVVQSQWDQERAMQMAVHAEEQMKARQREQALQKLVDKLRKDKANEANRIAAEYQRTIDSLRNRPEARAGDSGVPEGSDSGTGSAAGCTGAQLSGPDSRFLAGEAARADQLRIALRACQTAYDDVRREINGE